MILEDIGYGEGDEMVLGKMPGHENECFKALLGV